MTSDFPFNAPFSQNDTGDFESAINSVSEIQAELNYKQAKDSLRELVAKLDLSSSEKAGLEAEIQGLEATLDKLNRQQVQIAVFGMVGRGKSSLLNALLGQQIFATGPIHGVTTNAQAGQWNVNSNPQSPVTYRLSQIELIDTPGIDEVDGETREILAREVAGKADLIIFVVAGDMTKVEYQALSQLREAGKPMILVFNKIDQYPEADRLAIYQKIRDERVRELLSPDEIVMAAASPLVAQMVNRPDGTRGVQLTRSSPQIDELKLKILEILDREGKSLVALNSMLFAGEVNERIINRKLALREENANKIIWNCVITKAFAIALNPITAADLFSGAIIDVAMILTLSKLYGMEMTRTGALNLLQRIALSMGGLTVTDLVTNLGLSSLKSLLGIATPATGGLALGPYISVAVTQAGVAGVSTYAIGQVTKAYLANGASWGTDGPKAVVSRILSTLDETSIMGRIKEELWQKLRM